MKKLYSFLVFAFLLTTFNINLNAQNTQNPIWSMPPNYYSFPGGAFIPLPKGLTSVDYQGQPAEYCSNAIADAAGNIIFFIVDGSIYDGDGKFIDNFIVSPIALQDGHPSAITGINSEICIVPDPLDCDRYYIYFENANPTNVKGNFSYPYYTILDMSKNGIHNAPKGKLKIWTGIGYHVDQNYVKHPYSFAYNSKRLTNFRVPKAGGVYFAASPLRNDGSQFIYMANVYSNKIYRYVVGNSSGYSSYSFSFSSSSSTDYRAEMELVELPNGHYRIALPLENNSNQSVMIFMAELDNNGELIPSSKRYLYLQGSNSVDNPYIHGLEFSPNGDVLYVSHIETANYPDAIEYCYFSGGGLISLNLNNASDFQYSQIELGHDGKLYLTNDSRMATLDNPNNPNSINWNDNAKQINYSYTPYPNLPLNKSDKFTTYILPDQIDGMDYDSRSTNQGETDCCLKYVGYDADSYTVTSSWSTWTPGSNPINPGHSDIYIKDELRIPLGTDLSIENMVFHFAPGAKVVVERGNSNETGGRLNLDNTTFTSDNRCDTTGMWLGVQVYGYNNKSQDSYPGLYQQGWIVLNNNSVIENAYKGVVAAKFDVIGASVQNPNYDYSYAGGVIKADNSSFINNVNDIELLNYDYSRSISYFKNCSFITNGQLLDRNYTPNTHVKLINVKGISLTGCDFKNLTPQKYTPVDRGFGIGSFNAKFYVSSRCKTKFPTYPCTNLDSSNFSNLYYGIYAFNFWGTRTFTSTNNQFFNNQYGIYAGNVDFADIKNNDFKVPTSVDQTYGIYLAASTGYTVEENHFSGSVQNSIPLNMGNTYGIIVDNSGGSFNEIYKNYFEDLKIGGQAQRKNAESNKHGDPKNPPHNKGLHWKCNTFSNGSIFEADLSVTSGKIAYEQGYCFGLSSSAPAGNKFSHTGLPAMDIAANTSVKDFNYAYHLDAVTKPIEHSSNVYPYQCNVSLDSKSCPSSRVGGVIINPDLGGGIGVVQNNLFLQADSLRGNITEQNNVIDGGWTNDWLYLIATNVPGLKDTLLRFSPYLSDTVLTSYLNIQPPDNDIQAVILANSPVSDVVMNQLTTMTDISSEVMDNIEDAQTGELSERDILFQEIAYAQEILDRTVNIRLSLYLTDINGTEEDSVIAILERRGTETAKKQLCNFYIDMGNYAEADNVRNQIENDYGHDSYIDLVEISLQLAQQPEGLYALKDDPGLLNQVEDIAYDDDNFYSVSAKAMLSVALDTIFIPEVEPLYFPPMRRAKEEKEDKQETYSQLVIYPNPSGENDEVVIELQSNDPEVSMSSPSIEIYDLTGKLISTYQLSGKEKRITIPTSQLHSGVYFVKLSKNGRLIGVKKMVIQ